MAIFSVPKPRKVTWVVHHDFGIVVRSTMDARQHRDRGVTRRLQPGTYKLQAITASDSRSADPNVTAVEAPDGNTTLVSFNATFPPASASP